MWFQAMWYVTNQKHGVSALGLKRVLKLGSYRTAWLWMHKLRAAMVRPGRERLSGVVEVDETYIGGKKKGKRGRGADGKTLVLAAVQEDGNRIGRIRLRRVKDASAGSLSKAVKEMVEPGSKVRTDGWNGYAALAKHGYHHEIKKIAGSREKAAELLPHVHLIFSLLKRWLMGTHQGAVSSVHLPYYLDEFAFRFNRRLSTYRGKLFYRLMQQAVTTEATPFEKILVKKRPRKP